ncbi:SDR family NAD(P)-dependent oxidoreductase, partial [Pseudomonas sp. CCC2.2]|uniref:SDR family NAD(P)-dependent oxidoreductase n=1 Tax=Pseudomonas sp. CCC2.2 TaxID=3048605 RepID=UPI002B222FA3
ASVADAISRLLAVVSGASIQGIAADLSTADGVSALVKEAGGVDILVNNTGGPPPTTSHSQDAGLWSEQFNSMVLSVIKITDRVLPSMRQRGWGRVITSTSSGVV